MVRWPAWTGSGPNSGQHRRAGWGQGILPVAAGQRVLTFQKGCSLQLLSNHTPIPMRTTMGVSGEFSRLSRSPSASGCLCNQETAPWCPLGFQQVAEIACCSPPPGLPGRSHRSSSPWDRTPLQLKGADAGPGNTAGTHAVCDLGMFNDVYSLQATDLALLQQLAQMLQNPRDSEHNQWPGEVGASGASALLMWILEKGPL